MIFAWWVCAWVLVSIQLGPGIGRAIHTGQDEETKRD